MIEIKYVLEDILNKCDNFKRSSDNDTVPVLLQKIEDFYDIEYYVFGDGIISECVRSFFKEKKII